MIPVVLSGGSGTRLWPVSRTKLPKQFCSIFEQSLHTMTLNRLNKLGNPWVVTSRALRDLTVTNLQDLGMNPHNLMLEPMAKNTAPAIALMTYRLLRDGLGNEIVGVFPADHLIEDEHAFLTAISAAEKIALEDKIVTLGIQPDHPSTGYGYIQTKQISNNANFADYPVLKFHEKPSLEKAASFLKEGGYYWNAGIFIFKVCTMAKLLKTHQSTLWDTISSLKDDFSNIEDIYNNIDNISIDYAIMEKLSQDQLSCIPCTIGWNDVGSWDAVADLLGGAKMENKVEVLGKNNFVQSSLNKTYAFVEVEDLIVVDTSDALLISKKGFTQSVKSAVDDLKIRKPEVIKEYKD